MDNAILDVTIGLVFIYLLFSLFASVIGETVATLFCYRGRLLERGLEQMLDGKNYTYRWWDKVVNSLFWIGYWVFSARLVQRSDFFRSKKINKAPTARQASKDEQYKDEQYLRRAKLNKKAGLFAANVTSHPLYRRSSENNWLYKKPAYLGAATFSDILLDVFKPEGQVSPTLQQIKSRIDELVPVDQNPGLSQILNIYYEQANGDLQRFKLLTETWYDDTMDRVAGWYKRQTNKVIFIIGLVLAVGFNVSTIHIVDRLSSNQGVREAWANHAVEYVNTHEIQGSQQDGQTTPRAVDSNLARKNSVTTDTSTAPDKSPTLGSSAKVSPDKGSKAKVSIEKESTSKIDLNVKNTNAPKDTVSLEKAKQHLDAIKALYRQEDSLFGWNLPDYDSAIQYTESHNRLLNWLFHMLDDDNMFKLKARYVIYETFSPKRLIGFLITALAISLGAPFWFDLLNKFVNMRVSGKKPESTKPEASKTATLNQKPHPDPKSFA